jgi:hypothetical protein
MEFLGVIAYAIPRLGGNAFWCFTLMIEGAPKKNRHTVGCHSELVLVVSPGCASLPQRTLDQTGSPNAPALMQQGLDVAQLHREPDVKHHSQTDVLRVGN